MSQPTKKDAPKTAKPRKKADGFSPEERAAMKERAKELKSNPIGAVIEKIGEMDEPDQSMAKRVHEIILANAPTLTPKLWYGMPAYANKEGKVVCFFQSAQKFGARYATLGFNDTANLDDGNLWPVAFALKGLTQAEEAKIIELVQRATR